MSPVSLCNRLIAPGISDLNAARNTHTIPNRRRLFQAVFSCAAKNEVPIVCVKTRDRVTAEYALRNVNTPIGVAEFTTALPAALASSLPTIQQIEDELIQRPNPIGRELNALPEESNDTQD